MLPEEKTQVITERSEAGCPCVLLHLVGSNDHQWLEEVVWPLRVGEDDPGIFCHLWQQLFWLIREV